MAVATVGAMGCGEYAEGVAVMLFYQIGELFQSLRRRQESGEHLGADGHSPRQRELGGRGRYGFRR